MTTADPEHLPLVPGVSDDLWDAAAKLQDAYLKITGNDNTADFVLDVGFDATISGSLAIRPRKVSGGVRLDIGFSVEPTHLPPVRRILDALQHDELLTVYYRSGHTFADGRFWKYRLPLATFPNWDFRDFQGYKITQEKPEGSQGTQEIHDAIGLPGDKSLFGWVADNYKEGWLTCDDGPGGTADFLHVSPRGTLTILHVKGAKNDSRNRQVSAGAYEIVTSQASKNLVFTDMDRLRNRLLHSALKRSASWSDGVRVTDRSDFIEALDLRDATNNVRVVILQPHVSEVTHRKLKSSGRGNRYNEDYLRLNLLEGLLNSARSAIVGIGADLTVISAKE